MSISYGRRSIIKDLSFSVRPGEAIGILGHNGSGKSTLAFALAGIIPDLLQAELSGEMSMGEGNFGLVLQNPSTQFLATTVNEELGGRRPALARHLLDRNVSELSLGEQQQVNLAAALCRGASTLLLDEPLELLDPYEAKGFLAALQKAKEQGTTIVWFDHRPRFEGFVDRVIMLGDDEMMTSTRRHDSDPFPDPYPDPFPNPFPSQYHRLSSLLGSVDDHPVDISGAERRLSFSISRGEKVAVIGRNGSGKTRTLMALALAFCKKFKLSFSSQLPVWLQRGMDSKAIAFVHRLGVTTTLPRRLSKTDPATLSMGQQKLLSVASALADKSELAILDEPTTWIDGRTGTALCNHIKDSDRAIIVATHDPEVVAACDRVLIMEKGTLRCSTARQTRRFFDGSA
ncbi:MAG: ATP-binding cassette domain-containing protein [archaeon]